MKYKRGDIVHRVWDGIEMYVVCITSEGEIYCRETNTSDIFSLSLKYLATNLISSDEFKTFRNKKSISDDSNEKDS